MLRLLAGAARSPPGALRRLLHITTTGGGGAGKAESVPYRMSKLRAPSVVPRWGLTSNWCSLIGRIAGPVTPFDGSRDELPRALTSLSVSPSSSSSKFRVDLCLKGDLAKISQKYLKHNDLVYVSGFLSSHHKVSPSGEQYIFYKIYVQELNYVLDQNKPTQSDEYSIHPSSMPSANHQMLKENKYIHRLRLWQVFFANPYEWWDNRQSKPHISCPDFKHKDTREKIWIHPDDPPWVRRQLELHDMETSEKGHKSKGQSLENHDWRAQDFDYSDDDDDEVQHSAEA